VSSIAVLVPTLRRPDDLRRCLDALRRQHSRPDRVLVVRQPSDGETRAVLTQESELPVQEVLVHEPGQVAALNAGLEQAQEDIVAITDDDTTPWPTWIERIRSHFDREPEVGAVGGRDWLYRDGTLLDGSKSSIGQVSWYGRFIAFHHLGRGPAREVDFLKGANMSYRRVAIDSLSVDTGLKGRGVEYNNDFALSLAVKQRGWKVVYDPEVALDHYEARRVESQGRIKGGRRSDADRAVAADKAFNETYIAVKYLPLTRALVHLVFALAVGTGQAPGVGIATLRMGRIGGAGAAMAELRSNVPARLAGAWAGAKARLRT